MAVDSSSRALRKIKWIEGTSPDQRTEDVARRVIEARLQLVWQYLPVAVNGALEEIELVHQLRVSTRRAMAALEIFKDLLPSSRTSWMIKQLKRVRRAAGTARDLDVLIRHLSKLRDEHPDGPYAELLVSAERQREQAQQPICEIQDKLVRKDFLHRLALLLKRIRLRGAAKRAKDPVFGQTARKELRSLLNDFFTAAAGDLTDYEALHGFRIEGKRLRYAMEIFAGAFDASFRKSLYPLVESLQERLGEVNDHCAALSMFAVWPDQTETPGLAAALASLTTRQRTQLEASRQQFLNWWTPERCEDLAARFKAVLEDEGSVNSG